MRLVADSGLWRTGPSTAQTPLVAVLEVSGAVLSWTVDDPPGAGSTQITFTDLARADWLWRVRTHRERAKASRRVTNR